jgi:GH24 family phage-related lysozyme (muramidase)
VYRPYTKLDLPQQDIEALFVKRVESFEGQLRGCYPKYDTYPDSAKLALLDLAFNLGTSALRTEWPNLNTAIRGADWAAAAIHSRRPKARANRNSGTKALFEAAANEARASSQAATP